MPTDTERMDWLIRQEDPAYGGGIEWWHGVDKAICMLVITCEDEKNPTKPWPRFEGADLRACIDAAMQFESAA